MAVKAASKRVKRKEPGVNLRLDGRPRYEVRIRWTNADGTRGHLPTRVFPFDPEAKHGPTSEQNALDSANVYAVLERKARDLHDKPRSQLAEAWTFGGLLERLITELTLELESFEPGDGRSDKHLRTKISYARMLLGKADKKATGNPDGFPDLCALTVDQLRPEHFSGGTYADKSLVKRLKGKDGKPAPNDSIRRLVSFLAWFFKHVKGAWKIEIKNPLSDWQALELPEADQGRERTLSDEEWVKVDEALKAAWPSTRLAIHVARFTAARRGEVVNLDWKDLNLDVEHATALLRNTKSQKKNKQGALPRNREIPIPKKVADELRKLRQENGAKHAEGPVFIGQLGTRIGADTLTQAWNRACAKVGVKGARLHDLRHTRITELGDKLANPLQVAAVSGHSDMSMVKRYYNPNAQEIGRSIEETEGSVKAKTDDPSSKAIVAMLALSAEQLTQAITSVLFAKPKEMEVALEQVNTLRKNMGLS